MRTVLFAVTLTVGLLLSSSANAQWADLGNGLQLLDSFLTRNPDVRALLSSGYTDKNSLLEMARHRRISFLPKPYSLPVLYQTVAEVMEDQNAHLLD